MIAQDLIGSTLGLGYFELTYSFVRAALVLVLAESIWVSVFGLG